MDTVFEQITPEFSEHILKILAALPDQPVGAHLTEDEAEAYVLETCPPERLTRIEHHLDSCEACAAWLEALFGYASDGLAYVKKVAPASGAETESSLSELLIPLGKLLCGTGAHIRKTAAEALGRTGAAAAVPALIQALEDGSADVRERAASALGEIRDEAATPGLLVLLKDQDEQVRMSAAQALGRIKAQSAIPSFINRLAEDVSLLAGLNDEEDLAQISAAIALRRAGAEPAMPALDQAGPKPGSESPAIRWIGDTASQLIKPILAYLVPPIELAGAFRSAPPENSSGVLAYSEAGRASELRFSVSYQSGKVILRFSSKSMDEGEIQPPVLTQRRKVFLRIGSNWERSVDLRPQGNLELAGKLELAQHEISNLTEQECEVVWR